MNDLTSDWQVWTNRQIASFWFAPTGRFAVATIIMGMFGCYDCAPHTCHSQQQPELSATLAPGSGLTSSMVKRCIVSKLYADEVGQLKTVNDLKLEVCIRMSVLPICITCTQIARLSHLNDTKQLADDDRDKVAAAASYLYHSLQSFNCVEPGVIAYSVRVDSLVVETHQ